MFYLLIALTTTQQPPKLTLAGPWSVRIEKGSYKVAGKTVRVKATTVLAISPSTKHTVRGERHENLADYNDKVANWARSTKFKELMTSGTSAVGMLDPGSVVIRLQAGGSGLVLDKDYRMDGVWGNFGRIPGGAIPAGATVLADYDYGLCRIDSVIVDRKGKLILRSGIPHTATPTQAILEPGEVRFANVWVPGRTEKLTENSLYPIVADRYPVVPSPSGPMAAQRLPDTWRKLNAGEPVHILAWGDSVTDGGEASAPKYRYQSRFLEMLQRKFPKSNIRLTTAAWGGRSSDSFLNEPPSSQYNFEKAVLQPKPDLVVMEFVNDAGMTPEVVERKYGSLLKRFQANGTEWAIITPHYVRPDWMNAPNDRVEVDPRPYVAGIREFCRKHNVAIADASLRWGFLVKQGIPYMSLLSNCINHPNDAGHELFAQALMEMFEAGASTER